MKNKWFRIVSAALAIQLAVSASSISTLADTIYLNKGEFESVNNSSSLLNTKISEEDLEMQKALFLPGATNGVIEKADTIGGSTSGISVDKDNNNTGVVKAEEDEANESDNKQNTGNISDRTNAMELKTYYNYLIENGVLSNKAFIAFTKDKTSVKLTGLPSNEIDESKNSKSYLLDRSLLDQLVNCSEDEVPSTISKSDLLMALYRATYGEELSNPIAYRYEVPEERDSSSDSEIVTRYPNGGVRTFVSANVYEIYLNKMLEKGIISSSELYGRVIQSTEAKNFTKDFLKGYLSIQQSKKQPLWNNFTQLPTFKTFLKAASKENIVKYSNDFSLNYKLNGNASDVVYNDEVLDELNKMPLGKSVSVQFLDGNLFVREFYVQAIDTLDENPDKVGYEDTAGAEVTAANYPTVKYFKTEKLTVMDGLKYIERFMRLTEKDMTEREAKIVNYKCKVQLMDSLTESQKSTIRFLIAKGILNYESEEDYSLYTDVLRTMTWKDALRLLYRVKNTNARYDFSQVQMTDNDEFWEGKGYVETTVELNEALPDIEVIATRHKKIQERVDEAGNTITDQYGNALLEVKDVLPYEDRESDSEGAGIMLDDYTDPNENDNGITAKLMDTIAKSFSNLFNKATDSLYAETTKSDYYEVEMALADQNSNGDAQTGYTYCGEKLEKSPNVTKAEAQQGSMVTGYTNWIFKVNANTRNQAIAIVQQGLKVDGGTTPVSSVQGLCKMKDRSGNVTTLISQDALANLCSNIRIIDDNTFMNTDTGTCATILTNQKVLGGKSIAFVGNKVVVCDDMVVTDNTDVIYYNLEVICSLLSNASLKKISGNTEIYCSAQNDEEIYDVISSKDTLIERDYVTTFRGNESNGEATKFYNVDLMARALNTINRTWDGVTVTKSDGSKATTKITLIVDWNYVVPATANDVAIVNTEDKSDKLTLDKVNAFYTTEPTNKNFKDFWNQNLAVSNALVNAIYGTEDQTYITCGWLVPSITILTNAGGRSGTCSAHIEGSKKNKATYVIDSGSLSDSQIVNFFRAIGVKLDKDTFAVKQNGKNQKGDYNEWFQYYYLQSDALKKEASKYFQFRVMLGKKINTTSQGDDKTWAVYSYSPSTANTEQGSDAKAVGSAYLMTNNDVLYRACDNDERLVVDNSAKTITKSITNEDTNVAQPRERATITLGSSINNGSKYTFKYRGVSDDNKYYYLTLASKGGDKREDSFFTCSYVYDQTKLKDLKASSTQGDALNNKKRIVESETTSLDKYLHITTNGKTGLKGQSYKEYVDGIYNELGITEHGYGDANECFSYSTDYDGSPELSKGTWHLQFFKKGSGKKLTASAVEDDASSFSIYKLFNGEGSGSELKKEKLTSNPFSMQVTIQVPTNEYYFTTKANSIGFELHKGISYAILSSEVNFAGLNTLMRDTLYAQSGKVKKVNSLSKNAKVSIYGTMYKKTDKNWFVSDVIYNEADTCAQLLSLYNANECDAEDDAIKSELLKDNFLGCTITTGGRIYNFGSFVTDIGVGPLSEAVKVAYKGKDEEDAGKNVQLFTKGRELYYYNGKARKVKQPSEKVASANATCYCVKVKLSDELLCRSLDDTGSSYELLTVTDAYAGSHLGKLPFVYNNILDTNEEQEDLSFTLGGFNPTTFSKALKEKFLDDYNSLFQDNLLSFVRLLFINVLMYLIVITWVAYGILRSKIALNLLQALAQGESLGGINRKARGIDLLKIFTLGIYDVNDKPSFSKLIFMDIIFTIIIYFLFNGFT